ncbi:hypothetical protein HNQ80_004207 [Anaerosolibacter carboniphilus]|uniref:Uncharacterized protein n=1 Tax=Anaerosolibacter carboniphilus TaxID=1417629 RepID=A0A841L0G8_9FIRM|nr:hypothetical protein [Anaerosolibacter carboniphilus]MBB6218068.1 hypothetical protein [Anaerosolibacter carboniphilus]
MSEEKFMETVLDIPDEIYEIEFTPMEERLSGSELESGFKKLKKEIGEVEFQKYFNVLIDIKKYQKDMWIITFSENHCAIIIREYYDILKNVFDVSNIRVIVQSR